MRYVHDADAVRAAEEVLLARVPDGALMARASAGLAAVVAGELDRVYGARIVLLVGSGNNGGDALFAGALLARRGARVDAVLLTDHAHPAGLAALFAAGGRAGPGAEVLDGAELVVDGLLGIGGRGGLRPDAAAVVGRIHSSSVVAVDLPSGVGASTGEVDGTAVHADVTVTFGTTKVGLVVDPGAGCAGRVVEVDIGLRPFLGDAAAELLDAADVAALLPAPTGESDKYQRGVVGVVAGSDRYPGAAVLCSGGALRAGAGMVRYAGPDVPTDLVRRRWPETVPGLGRVQAWVGGPGLGTDDDARGRLATVLDAAEPAVVDADGLTLLAQAGRLDRDAPTVLTPHAGELSRLLDVPRADIEAHRLRYARAAAVRYGATVLLKGSTTVVVAPDGRTRVNPTGTPWLATAGSGDVLAGVVGALLGGGLDPLDAASVGAWLHGAAARRVAGDPDGTGRAGVPVIAEDVLGALPAARRALTER